MHLGDKEPESILHKSLALAQKSSADLEQLDPLQFPTDSSGAARKLLLDAFAALRVPANLVAVSPAVLYNRLFSLRDLADKVHYSSTLHISWPLVSYCDEMWRQLFGPEGPKIFYSVTPEHNYKLVRFTQQLVLYLEGILPEDEIDALSANRTIYCLQLASSEDQNLPLYANIGHEFGHAVFDDKSRDLLQVLSNHTTTVLQQLYADVRNLDAQKAERRFDRLARIVLRIATELFCDLVGASLMGPAFLLSLYELSWGQDKDVYSIALSPNDAMIRAYPSFNFRLHCTKSAAEADSFCQAARQDFDQLPPALKPLAECLRTVPTAHTSDRVRAAPPSDPDAGALQTVLAGRLTDLKASLEAFAQDCRTLIAQWYPHALVNVMPRDVAQLVLRLHEHILPNIVPNGTLLGTPASFSAMITASALVRLQLLTSADTNDQETLFEEMNLIERLTAKALEVSFTQARYKDTMSS